MDPALAPGTPPKSVIFQDGLGERRRISDVSGADTIEQLCLRGELTAIPSFEFALRERASRLANFRHVYYARVRSVDRLNDPTSTLAIVSDSIKGVRLANLLAANDRAAKEGRPQTLDINASLHLIRQVVAAVAMLHENARDVAHGAIGPERIIVTPNARIVLVEYVLGAALEQLHFSPERYWKELRVAVPPSHGLPHFDHRTDVTQIGVVALSLILGRQLREDEYPSRIADVLASATATSQKGEVEPLPEALRSWIGRALQLDVRRAFTTALEARDELDRVLSGEEEEDEEQTEPVFVRPEPVFTKPEPVAFKPEPVAFKAEPVAFKPEPAAFKPEAKPDFKSELKPDLKPSFAAPAAYSPPVAYTAPMHDFTDEDEPRGEARTRRTYPWNQIAIVAVAAIAVVALVVFGARKIFTRGGAAVTGTLSINSNPPGAQVVVDGQASGVTPTTLTLKAGSHNVELRGAGEPRTVPVTITAGTQVSQYIELPKTITAFGELQVRTEPAGAQVTVDGIPRGKSPVLVESLAAGEHTVVLEGDGNNVKHTVTVEAGVTASLVVPMAAADNAPASGWISVAAPLEVQIYENKRLIGTSQSDRLMIAAGKHELEIVNEAVGYRQVRTVQVPTGRLAAIKLEWPKGSIAINALPWADVWIDGERVGETPIGNLSLPVGPHEIVFRHPELGEQRYATTVSLKAPARVSVDLRKK